MLIQDLLCTWKCVQSEREEERKLWPRIGPATGSREEFVSPSFRTGGHLVSVLFVFWWKYVENLVRQMARWWLVTWAVRTSQVYLFCDESLFEITHSKQLWNQNCVPRSDMETAPIQSFVTSNRPRFWYCMYIIRIAQIIINWLNANRLEKCYSRMANSEPAQHLVLWQRHLQYRSREKLWNHSWPINVLERCSRSRYQVTPSSGAKNEKSKCRIIFKLSRKTQECLTR